jgi:hypothetical protein
MRTTIDLPDDLHRLTVSLARAQSMTLSQLVAGILRRSLLPDDVTSQVMLDEASGLPRVRLGRPITADDVRDADEER